ncbi:MAG: hypothetical protein M3Q23_15895 [Actinomycetota bacterium]|nr:hypothetical protein [Actinomycetota bacterium]
MGRRHRLHFSRTLRSSPCSSGGAIVLRKRACGRPFESREIVGRLARARLRFCLVYFSVDDLQAALERVRAAGGEVVHPGERWVVCRDSEGSPFGLAQGSLSEGVSDADGRHEGAVGSVDRAVERRPRAG